MSLDTRIDRLYPALTAKERARLVLQALKEDREEDWRVRSQMPNGQVREFNRYIRLINAVNSDLSVILVTIHEQFAQVEIKDSWLTTILLFGGELERLSAYLLCDTKEPITESGLRARTDELRGDVLSLDDAAALMTEEHPWHDADVVEGDAGRVPSEDAWDRVFDEHERTIREAVASGVLSATGKGRRLRIMAGNLYDWWGREIDVFPEWGFEYDVRPDAEADDVAKRAAVRDGARKLLRRLIPGDDWPEEIGSLTDGPEHERLARSLAAGLAAAITAQLSAHWMQLQALERVVAEISEELDEEAMEQPSRKMADDLALRMRQLAEKVRMHLPDYALPEPDEAALGLMRRFIDHAERDG